MRIISALMAAVLAVVILVTARSVIRRGRIEPTFADTIALARLQRELQATSAQKPRGEDGRLSPRAEDATVAWMTSRLLSRFHYAKKKVDEDFSARWMDRYLDLLDPQHYYFTQADIASFEPLRKEIGPKVYDKGDTEAAYVVFRKYLQRIDEQNAYVQEMLKDPKFDFTGHDTFTVNRKSLPRPKDEGEAKTLWRDRVRFEFLQEKLNKMKPEDAIKTLVKRYNRTVRSLHEFDADDVFEVYLSSMGQVYDPHSTYMGKSTVATFNIQMKLSVVGIGAQITSEDGYPKISDVVAGGPASKSGRIKPGDRIVGVAQGDGEFVDVVDMKVDRVVELIRGKKGTPVRMKLWPADATDPSIRRTVTIVREEVKLEEQEAKAKVYEVPNGVAISKIAVIDVPSFYEDSSRRDNGGKSTTTDVARLLKKLNAEKVDGIVLDLRKNPGGSLTEAIKLTGLFIKGGPIVQVKESTGAITVDDDPDSEIRYSGPLVVLTSRFSASASEILAGALQDYGRAVIVGDTSTHGKGTVQTIIQLSSVLEDRVKLTQDPGALKLTIQKFYRPSGSSTQLRGVVPDIILPSRANVAEVGEQSLQNPLAWDTIPAATYTKLNWIQPFLPELRRFSASRVATEPEFVWLQEDIGRFKKALDQKTVSLNEEERIKEKLENDARVDLRKKSIAALHRPPEKEILLALRNVDSPGLPAATLVSTLPKKPARAADPDDAETEAADAIVPRDIHLFEARNILVDLIKLSHGRNPVVRK